MTQLLKVKEAASLLGVKPDTLRAWVRQRRIALLKSLQIPLRANTHMSVLFRRTLKGHSRERAHRRLRL
jgi:transposase-like protein